MEMDKYFIPEISDLHVEYECERNMYIVGEYDKDISKRWMRWVIEDGSDIINIIRESKNDNIRVPYLTQEQIEAEGWNNTTLDYQKIMLFVGEKVQGYYYKLVYNYWNHRLSITEVDDSCLFSGECKSINELRYICKLLKI